MKEKELIRELYSEFEGNKAGITRICKNLAEKVSSELYSQDIHFVFELIQNAEDNDYEQGVKPVLKFAFFQLAGIDWLLVENNERGFLPDHVRSLCSAGDSTKKNKTGYIGQKGIGFKSVFAVSNEPMIFSGKFQFSIPRYIPELKIGYFAPVWQDKPPVQIDPDKTNIILPLEKEKAPKIAAELAKFKAETILFLKKIKVLTFNIESLSYAANKVVEKEYEDVSNLVCLQTTYKMQKGSSVNTKHRYYVFSRVYSIPPDLFEEQRSHVKETEVSVALPIDSNPQMLFAYLPVWEEGTGVPFIINSDFILTSSREEIHEDRPWNCFLRDQIGNVYCEALLDGMRNARLIAGHKVALLKSLPEKAAINFLKPVEDYVRHYLETAEFVPVISGKLCLPADARIADSAFYSLFCNGTTLPEFLQNGLNLVDPAFISVFDRLRAYGVEDIQEEEIEKCFADRSWCKFPGKLT